MSVHLARFAGSLFESADLAVESLGEAVIVTAQYGDRKMVWAGTADEAWRLAQAISDAGQAARRKAAS